MTNLYAPPGRTSASHEMKVMPKDLGVHHFMMSSGVVQASQTMRAGASKLRVTTTSRSEWRSVVVTGLGGCSLARIASMGLFLLLELFNDLVQFFEARRPHLAVALDPGGFLLEAAAAEAAGANPPNLLGGHQTRLLVDADVLLHAGEGHVEALGELGDGGIGAAELLEHTATRCVRDGGERGVETSGLLKLNHMVR